MRASSKEFSAGGVVTRGDKVLLIRMRTLQGELVWTYPKGHVEAGETPRRAALREAAEETGWECEIVGPLCQVRYSFRREGRLVRKRVRWYRMRPVRRAGPPDAKEIFGLRWVGFDGARALLRYPADLRLLDRVRAPGRGR